MLSRYFRKLEEISKKNPNWGRNKLANAVGCSEKVARNYLRKKRDGIAEVIENSETSNSDLASQIIYHKERSQYLERQFNSIQKSAAFEARLLDIFDKRITEAGPLQPLPPVVRQNPGEGRSEELVVNIGCIHGGEEVNYDEVLGLNEYNIDIMKQRLIVVRDTVLNIVNAKMTGYHFQKLHVFLLGDLVSGIIHDELIQNTPIVDQVLIVGDALSQIIQVWAAEFPELEVSGVVGNHGRMKKKPYYHKKYNNFDYLVMKYIEVHCKDIPNIKFNIPKSPMMPVKIFDWNFLLTHGDGVKSAMGIPFYGMKRMDANLSQTLTVGKGYYPHYIVMGHFHTNNVLSKPGGEIIMNGSLKGADPFALNAMHVGGEPVQKMFSVHPEHGITWRMNIDFK